MRIIVDAMGGDYAPDEIVLGALDAAKELNVEITLVGRGEEILKLPEGPGDRDAARRGGDRPRGRRCGYA